MKTRTIISAILILIAMVLVPILTVTAVLGGDAMGIMLILTVALNPVISLIVGILSGWGEKMQWYFPIANAVVYLIAAIAIMSFDISLLVAAAVYLVFGLVAAYITNIIKKRKTK